MKKIAIILILMLILGIVFISGCTQQNTNGNASIKNQSGQNQGIVNKSNISNKNVSNITNQSGSNSSSGDGGYKY
jgi:outer membrane lipoprotein-sorting protein